METRTREVTASDAAQQISLPSRTAYSIFIDTICQGRIPAWHDEDGKPVVYETELDAQREIAEDEVIRLEQFLQGERDFDDACTIEDYVCKVEVFSDGSIRDEDGNTYSSEDR